MSRDGRRVYFTNSLYAPWDAQFYPDGIRSWMVKLDAKPEGGMAIDPKFFLEFGESPRPSDSFGGWRRIVRLVLLLMNHFPLWPWAALFLLGAYHGMNPGMGWLFAVALGMQKKSAIAVWQSLDANCCWSFRSDRTGRGRGCDCWRCSARCVTSR